MTLNGYFMLNCFRAGLAGSDFRKIFARKPVKIDTYCHHHKSLAGTLISGNISFVRIFARVL